MSDKHSNEELMKEISSSHELSKAVESLTDDAQETIRHTFKKQFGTDLPTAGNTIMLVENTTVQFASSSIIEEYTQGLESTVESIGSDYSKTALAAIELAQNVLSNIVGSDTIESTNDFESQSTTEDDGTTTITAVMVQSSKISKKDWKVKEDFFVSAYLMIICNSDILAT